MAAMTAALPTTGPPALALSAAGMPATALPAASMPAFALSALALSALALSAFALSAAALSAAVPRSAARVMTVPGRSGAAAGVRPWPVRSAARPAFGADRVDTGGDQAAIAFDGQGNHHRAAAGRDAGDP
jgi:hypothetical protein